jgi:starch-binding outer membrane protein, SusD/RagB family
MTTFRTLARRSARLGTLAALCLAGACSEANERLLQVTDPDIIDPGNLTSAEGAAALANGTINTFRSVTGSDESTWLFGGLLADEWSTSSTFIQNDETDQRTIPEFNSSITGMLRRLYRTRTRATEAITTLRQYSPNSRASIAEMYLARGFAELQLASDFCNGIPIADAFANPPENGTPRSTRQVFTLAAASLDSGLTFANGTDAASVLMNRTIRVARARVALALGQFTEAGALVAGVPTAFAYQHTFSLTTSTNTLWGQGISSRRYSVGDSVEGNARNILVRNAIPFASSRDPRLPVTIPTTGAINGQDGQTYTRTTAMWGQLTSVDVANGVDARMIEAEVLLRAGNATQWLAIHNALRAAPPRLGEIQPAAMPALVDPGTEAARVSLHFREKAFWTFSRGQRLGDMRRLITQYGRTEQTVFPQGVHYKGGNYGRDVNLPIVTDERNNPNFTGCTDRNP